MNFIRSCLYLLFIFVLRFFFDVVNVQIISRLARKGRDIMHEKVLDIETADGHMETFFVGRKK